MSQSPRPDGEDEKAEKTPEEPGSGKEDKSPKPMDYPEYEVKEQDRWLPIANVARIMKSSLPDNAKIAKEAKECMQECVSEFISFITSEASEKCQQEKRKTVNGEDIIFAMTSLGFENYSEALKIYLSRYRETLTARGDAKGGPSGQAGNGDGYEANNNSELTGSGTDGGSGGGGEGGGGGGGGSGSGGGEYPYGVAQGGSGDYQ